MQIASGISGSSAWILPASLSECDFYGLDFLQRCFERQGYSLQYTLENHKITVLHSDQMADASFQLILDIAKMELMARTGWVPRCSIRALRRDKENNFSFHLRHGCMPVVKMRRNFSFMSRVTYIHTDSGLDLIR